MSGLHTPSADKKPCIGVFDSGIGGVSVLRALAAELPYEDFLFYGDSAHAPWGERTQDEVLDLARGITSNLIARGAKAVVIACNTATSVAANTLREEYPAVPIVGIEPAVKPACERPGDDPVLVMATEITLKLDRFAELARACENEHEIIPVPCPGLAARIEQGNLDAPDVQNLINDLVGDYAGKVGSVVLGCTHYPFVRDKIVRALGGNVATFDGGEGTARQLRVRLTAEGLLAKQTSPGSIRFDSSNKTPEQLTLYRTFFEMPL